MTETLCGKCRQYICDCTCPDLTGYSKKRRLLREHRKTMRVMERVILDNNLGVAFSHELNAAPGAPQDWDVQECPHLDESSDMEDPEKKANESLQEYKKEVADKERLFEVAVLETARRSVEDKQVHLDLERARMEMEDLRGQMLRAK